MDETLMTAYRDTHYVVDDDPPLVLRIDERNDGVRILFASFNVESAAFITAWNPGSEPLGYGENVDRQADLLEDIEALRLNYFVGRGEHPLGLWAEESYFVMGISKDEAIELARKYGQHAFVWMGVSGVPELVLTAT